MRLALAAAFVLVLAAQIYAFHAVRQDDAFISFRYGQNLAQGAGLTFNPGERFLGATSPGHMLLAALSYALFGRDATPSVMCGLSCIAWSAQAIAIAALLVPLSGLRAWLPALAIDLGLARSFMWVPFESNLMAALALFALHAAQRARWTQAAVLAALACLMRPDAALLALVLGTACVIRERRRALRPTLAFAALTLPWVGFATAYYGSPLPHSAVEKFQRTEFRPYTEHALRFVAETALPYAHALPWLMLAGLALAGFSGYLGAREPALRWLGLYALLHLVAYLFLRPFSGHDWHLYPLALAGGVVLAGGLCVASACATRPALRALGDVALIALIAGAALRSVEAAQSYGEGRWTGARDRTYREVAAWLVKHASKGDHFACVEVGTLAYYSGLSAYDLGGLVTDLRKVNMIDRPVRWLVLDKHFIAHAPPWPPVFKTGTSEFEASVFYVPKARGNETGR